jgi:NAD(P)H-quinone oxidoreductase subunit 5
MAVRSLETLVLAGLGAPVLLLLVLGSASIVNRQLPERWIRRLVVAVMTWSTAAMTTALLWHLLDARGPVLLSYGGWSTSRGGGIRIEFLLDATSLAFAALSAVITGVVAAFSHRYLHREPGYNRYFVLLALFVTGMFFVALAGNVEVLFAGWEFIGLSSALLVAFFHDRPAPVSNALRVQAVYRISDAAMLAAAVLLHHAAGSGSLSLLVGGPGVGPGVDLPGSTATIIAVLLVVAVAAKSALLPFSGWLPRAMEGPTPSSAVYYGALSIHAGCFLLLRAAPLLEQAPAARLLAGGLGLATAVFATMTMRVQSDIKSSLSYASLTQVGIIVVEIALGLYTIAFVHLAGHACFRLLQFLSAPNILHDLHGLESAAGAAASGPGGALDRLVPVRLRTWLYLVALERGFLDAILDRLVVTPFQRLARRLSRFDRFLCDVVIGTVPPQATADQEHDHD